MACQAPLNLMVTCEDMLVLQWVDWVGAMNRMAELVPQLAMDPDHKPYKSKYLLRRYLDPPKLHNSVSNHLLRRYLDPYRV